MQHKRIGIIDLGSNTTRLIVMEYEPGHSFRLIDEVRESVRLIEGMGEDNMLQPAAMDRAVHALDMFAALCRSTGVDHVVVAATSAVRDAANQMDLLTRLRREMDLDVRVLTGQQEAYYGYLGVVNSLPISDGFVVDIGGGSTEITAMQHRQFQQGVSLPVGIVRYKDRYLYSDPVSKKELVALEKAVQSAFSELDWLQGDDAHMLVGVGGTVRNLAKMDQKQRNYPLDKVHGYELTATALDSLIHTMRKLTVAERGALPGLSRDRADVILPGAVILRQIMQKGGFERLLVGGQALREGLFYEHFLADKPLPLFDDVRRFATCNMARLYEYEKAHAEKVQELSSSLFDQLQPLHGMGAWERELLEHAALLHDIGVSVGYYDHHKHSEYLLLNASLPGFIHREIAFLALLVRSHRKGDIKFDHYRMVLQPGDEERIIQLGALLRLAEHLERSKTQVVRKIDLDFVGSTIIGRVHLAGDGTPEIWNASQRTRLFRKAFGRDIELVDEHSPVPVS